MNNEDEQLLARLERLAAGTFTPAELAELAALDAAMTPAERRKLEEARRRFEEAAYGED